MAASQAVWLPIRETGEVDDALSFYRRDLRNVKKETSNRQHNTDSTTRTTHLPYFAGHTWLAHYSVTKVCADTVPRPRVVPIHAAIHEVLEPTWPQHARSKATMQV